MRMTFGIRRAEFDGAGGPADPVFRESQRLARFLIQQDELVVELPINQGRGGFRVDPARLYRRVRASAARRASTGIDRTSELRRNERGTARGPHAGESDVLAAKYRRRRALRD
jgi:hypothetical protein